MKWWQFKKRARCPHTHLRGIYGDEINRAGARLHCLDCGRLLDGPVVLARIRVDEADRLTSSRTETP